MIQSSSKVYAGICISVACIAVCLLLFLKKEGGSAVNGDTSPEHRANHSHESVRDSLNSAKKQAKQPQVELDSQLDELEGYGFSSGGVKEDLELVQNLIAIYLLSMKFDGSLPTAGNREIMSAMLGNNRYKMRFVRPDFPFLNAEGEIIDRWGNPLSFHFQSYESPEIRSFGPDGIPWTKDDVEVSLESKE